jgi:N-dimethylarginine dimethylaminohydrolase
VPLSQRSRVRRTVPVRRARRRGAAYLNWFAEHGFDTYEAEQINEGEGDLLHTDRFLLAGTGLRTDHSAHAELQELFGLPVITLQLIDPHFYHLDTALTVLGGANVAYLPEAFSDGSRRVLKQLFPDAIIATPADGAVLGLNAVCDGAMSCSPSRQPGSPTSSPRAASSPYRWTCPSC